MTAKIKQIFHYTALVIDPLDVIATVVGGILGTGLAIVITNMI